MQQTFDHAMIAGYVKLRERSTTSGTSQSWGLDASRMDQGELYHSLVTVTDHLTPFRERIDLKVTQVMYRVQRRTTLSKFERASVQHSPEL
jgi:hypothetical protein